MARTLPASPCVDAHHRTEGEVKAYPVLYHEVHPLGYVCTSHVQHNRPSTTRPPVSLLSRAASPLPTPRAARATYLHYARILHAPRTACGCAGARLINVAFDVFSFRQHTLYARCKALAVSVIARSNLTSAMHTSNVTYGKAVAYHE